MIKFKIVILTILGLLLFGCSPQEPLIPDSAATEETVVAPLTEVEEEPATRPTPTIASSVQPVQPETAEGEANTGYPPAVAEAAPQTGYPPAPVVVQNEAYPESEEMVDEPSLADANVTFVRAEQAADGTWTFHVTVEHPDTGWEDYANGWDIITTQGQVIKKSVDEAFTRVLTHPHENEQPFTRSQSGLVIPTDVTEVFVRAHDIVHGWGGDIVYVDLTTSEGQNYEVVRAGE